MKISESVVRWNTDHGLAQRSETRESLRLWIGNPPEMEQSAREGRDRVELSAQALAVKPPEMEADAVSSDGIETLEILIVEELIQLVTGRVVRITSPQLEEVSTANALPAASSEGGTDTSESPRPGWGLEYSRVETFAEEEHLEVRAEGRIRTQDGRELPFQTRLQMDRAYFVENSIRVRAGDAVMTDPLVLNWDGRGVRLTEQKVDFDLNADGTAESLSWLQSGSGFLALDRNQDGWINDGGELFGPQSGNGFQDLAAFDQDQSGWIDESDPVFGRLRVWTRDPGGTERLITLAEAGVGALATRYADSPFQLKNAANESLGEVVRSSLYLREDGETGFIQQINLTI